MNPVEIGEAVFKLALEPFDAAEFPLQCLAASGDGDTKRFNGFATTLQSHGRTLGAALRRGYIHVATGASNAVDGFQEAFAEEAS